MMQERPLTIEAARAILTHAARNAERARWRYVSLRDPMDGKSEKYPSNAAENADRAETALFEKYNTLTCFGVIDADNADAIVAAERKRVREELDEKWPREESL